MAKWKKLSHVVYQSLYNIMWCPKYRHRILKEEVSIFIEEKIRRYVKYQEKNERLEEDNEKEYSLF